MKYEIENLFNPRYKVIADYPSRKDDHWNVGDVITLIQDSHNKDKWVWHTSFKLWDCESFDFYRHLFRNLEWYEERDVNEMPQYLKYPETGEVFKPTTYKLPLEGVYSHPPYFNTGELVKRGKYKDTEEMYNLAAMLPATEEEYNAYITSKKE